MRVNFCKWTALLLAAACVCAFCGCNNEGDEDSYSGIVISQEQPHSKTTAAKAESVIFSMQTFVVKLASGLAVFITGVGLDLIGLVGNNSSEGAVIEQTAGTIMGLRMLMTLLPVLGLGCALMVFRDKFTLTDERAEEIAEELRARRGGLSE